MEWFEIIGYLIGFVIGIIMGLIGGGGSVLLPTMVFVMGVPTTLATAYTGVLVGVTALAGVLPRLKAKQVDFSTAITLGLPVLAGTLLVRGKLTHMVADSPSKELAVFLAFAFVLLLSFASMKGLIGKNMKPNSNLREERPGIYYCLLVGFGLFIGLLTGFIGAGGGVMIVPLLVLVMGLPMRTVVGTSLAIMACKAIVGFLGDVWQINAQIDYPFLATYAGVMIAGVLVGSKLSHRVSSEKLKQGFAWFILAMAIFILVQKLLLAGPEAV